MIYNTSLMHVSLMVTCHDTSEYVHVYVMKLTTVNVTLQIYKSINCIGKPYIPTLLRVPIFILLLFMVTPMLTFFFNKYLFRKEKTFE